MADEFEKYKVAPQAEGDEFEKYKVAPQAEADEFEKYKTTLPSEKEMGTMPVKRDRRLLPAEQPVLTAGENEFGDLPSQIGTGLENFISGLTPFNIGRTVEGGIGRVLEGFGLEDNPLTPENIEHRELENPTLALTTNIAGALTGGGLSLLSKAAPNVFAKLMSNPIAREVVRTAMAMDFATPIAEGQAAKASLRALQKGSAKKLDELRAIPVSRRTIAEQRQIVELEREVATTYDDFIGQADTELARLTGRPPATLTAQEAKLQGQFAEATKPTVFERARGIKAPGKAEALATERALKERANALIADNLKEQYANLGFSEKLTLRIDGAKTGAAIGGLTLAGQKLLERPALSKEQIASISEDYSAQLLNDYLIDPLIGAGVGATLGGGAPLVADGIAYSLFKARRLSALLGRTLIPPLASLRYTATGGEKGVSARLARGATQLADISAENEADVTRTLRELRGTLEYQYNNIDDYLTETEDQLGGAGRLGPAFDRLKERILAAKNAVKEKYTVAGAKPGDPIKFTQVFDEETRALQDPTKVVTRVNPATGREEPVTRINPRTGRVEAETQFEGTFKFPEAVQQLDDALRELTDMRAGAGVTTLPKQTGLAGALAPEPNTFNPATIRVDDGSGLPYDEMLGSGRLAAIDETPYLPVTGDLNLPTDRTSAELAGLRTLRSAENIVAGQLGKAIPTGLSLTDTLTKGGALLGIEAAASKAGLPPYLISGLVTAGNVIYDPKILLDGFLTLQKKQAATQKLMTGFASALTRDRKVSIGATKALLSGELRDYMFPSTATAPTIVFDDEQARTLYKNDKALIEMFTGADAIEQFEARLGDKLEKTRLTFPSIADNSTELLPKQVKFLKDKFDSIFKPRADNIAGYKEIEPTSQQMYTYGLYSRYVHNPDVALYDIVKKNYVPDAAVDVLEQLYPSKFNELKNTLLTTLLEGRQNGEILSPSQTRIISKLFKKDANEFTVEQIQTIQATFAEEAAPAPSGTGGRLELEKKGTTNE